MPDHGRVMGRYFSPTKLQRLVAALALAFAAPLTYTGAALAQQDQSSGAQSLPFLTVRDRTGEDSPQRYFGDDRSDLKAGWCDIAETKLSLLTPLAEASTLRIPDEIMRVTAIRETSPEGIYDALEASTGPGSPLLYTHGFFIDFEKGCRRANLFKRNTQSDGRFLWFSWPSDGAIFNYTHDEADLYWSVPEYTNIILELQRRFGPDRVNLAAHSLGARGLVLALNEVAIQAPETRVGHVVLLAPDMDAAIFGKILPRVRAVATSLTVYVSDSDRPLDLSEQLHGYARLGQAGYDVSGFDGVEVIDVSALPLRSPTGHLYHIYNPTVGADLDQLLNEGKSAAQRSNLSPLGPNLWALSNGPAEN
ncbi:MAG: alpha/beta hydrolase [Dinoroseobacter sp.]|nr:alpha/beta hydrolase [Dinoroseobacter sp.]